MCSMTQHELQNQALSQITGNTVASADFAGSDDVNENIVLKFTDGTEITLEAGARWDETAFIEVVLDPAAR
jgi:hypothetical protein